ncbi:MAG: T9SS type A sorting domain-containing protein [Bacteroidetes bacterium]|nr:T9SS type A sorting domain-containing protein [Bacteroidota bacterium]
MKKHLLFLVLLASFSSLFAQNMVVDYDFNPALRDNTVNLNHLHSYGSGSAYNFIPLGSTGVTTDTCIGYVSGIGLESDNAINNSNWPGAAVSFWIMSNSQAATSTTGFIVQGAYLGFGVKMGSGKMTAFFDGTSAGALPTNFEFSFNNLGWHHVVAQNNGLVTSVYVDGGLDRQFADTLYNASGPNANAKIYIGTAVSDLAPDKLNGLSVDELKVFDNALSLGQIQQLIQHQDISVGIAEEKSMNFEVYPNPANDLLNIAVNAPFTVGSVEILNQLGQVVGQYPLSETTTTIEMPSTAGLYYVNATVDGKHLTKKVIRL